MSRFPVSCDLRGNQGGNVWPMVVGLTPLLGENWRSFEVDADGKTTSAGYLENGAAIAGEGDYQGQTIVRMDDWRSLPRLATVPVAVLIDDAVGSSGEGVAVAFRGRPKARFFGEKTYGVASSNEGFIVADRINVVVTTAMMADRDGRIYPDGIVPDTLVSAGPGSSVDPDDAVVESAKIWLARQSECSSVQIGSAH
ncbi:S41 family peptidase [Sphingomicrobium sp. XHP0235]|uniref:S41 family peptidase n=1 Tax=Sphingomicrobium aquimarinum TaxID=3133971 RepID=UPI0031FF2357